MNAATITYEAGHVTAATHASLDGACTGTRSIARSLVAPARRLDAIQRVAAAVSRRGDVGSVCNLAAREAARLMRADDAAVVRVVPGHGTHVCGRAWTPTGTTPDRDVDVTPLPRPWLPAIGPLRISPPRAALLFGPRCVDALVIPVCVCGGVHGAVAVGSERPAAWDQDAVSSLQALAALLAAVLMTPAQPEAAVMTAGRESRVAREMRLAVEHDELFLRYQPIISLSTGEPHAFEALLRWRHPRRGVLGPSRFLGAAHATGAIREMTDGVVRGACRDVAHLNAARPAGLPIAVSVNLSGPQLDDGRLLPTIVGALHEHCLNPEQLWLEITEDTVVGDGSTRLERLHDLHRMGVKIALDDFGSGCASLGHVRRLPLDLIKLDRSLVRGATRHACDARILAAAIEMTHALGIDVVAEGCETAAQLAQLQELGCGLVQGYYLSRPVDAQRATQLVATPLPWLEGGAAIRRLEAAAGEQQTVRG